MGLSSLGPAAIMILSDTPPSIRSCDHWLALPYLFPRWTGHVQRQMGLCRHDMGPAQGFGDRRMGDFARVNVDPRRKMGVVARGGAPALVGEG